MARVLVVYHRGPWSQWRSTYESHLSSFRRYSDHDCFYLNTASSPPRYLTQMDFDLVILHYTFLAVRQRPEIFAEQFDRIRFIGKLQCPKALVPHDEQAHADLLNDIVRELGVTHVFTPSSSQSWRQIYADVDFDQITFRTVLTGYIDGSTVRSVASRAERNATRSIDIGYRSWSIQPSYGRHGLLKGEIGRVFSERAPEFGLACDISSDYRDALLGDDWFDFLLNCKYTIGVEGGSSILDWDGAIAKRSRDFTESHVKWSFEDVEAACFPDLDGHFDYRLLGPRHLEAVITKTCQVLMEGAYGGTLEPGLHYIELKRDFSNLDDVLALLRDDGVRADMVERAYRDVVESNNWTYEAFARLIFSECLADGGTSAYASAPRIKRDSLKSRVPRDKAYLLRNRVGNPAMLKLNLLRNRISRHVQVPLLVLRSRSRRMRDRLLVKHWYDSALGRSWWRIRALNLRSLKRAPLRELIRDGVVLLVGEERLWRTLTASRNVARKLRGLPPQDVGNYVPTEAEVARRSKRSR